MTVTSGQLREWVDCPELPDGYSLQSFVVVSPRANQSDPRMNQSWWILMGGELIWETEDIIELYSDPIDGPMQPT